jgi:hypothetical protein
MVAREHGVIGQAGMTVGQPTKKECIVLLKEKSLALYGTFNDFKFYFPRHGFSSFMLIYLQATGDNSNASTCYPAAEVNSGGLLKCPNILFR